MRILHCTTTADRGGAGLCAAALHRSLVDLGHDSVLAVAEGALRHPRSYRIRRSGPLVRACRWEDRLLRCRSDPRSTTLLGGSLQRLVARIDPDVVHLHWIQAGAIGFLPPPNLDRPLVWTLHDCWPISGTAHLPGSRNHPVPGMDDLHRRLKARMLARAHGVALVAPSRDLATRATASSFADHAAIFRIPHAVALDRFAVSSSPAAQRSTWRLPPDEPALLFVSADLDAPYKGLESLIGALAKHLERPPLLVLAGASAPKRLPAWVRWVGPVEPAHMPGLMRTCDLVVSASEWESFGMTILESMACARPSVAFASGGPADLVVDGVTGLLVQPGDYAEMARRIGAMMADRIAMRRMGRAARIRAERCHAPADIAHRHLRLYRLMSERRESARRRLRD